MTVGTYPLSLYQGDDHELRVEFQDADEAALDVSDYSFRAQIRRHPTSATALADADVDLTDAADGVVVVRFASADTSGLPATGWWDFEQTDVDGLVTTLMRGEVTVTREVTR